MTWDERYLAGECGTRDPDPVLRRAIEPLRPGRALDLACGAGRHALFLAGHGWRVTAVDASSAAIEILKARAASAKLEIEVCVADLERGEFRIEADAWDLIADFLYLQRDLFPALKSGVRPGGIFAAVFPMADPRPGVRPMNPAFLVEPGELAKAFDDWEILHLSEGPRAHSSSRAMCEFVARRPVIY